MRNPLRYTPGAGAGRLDRDRGDGYFRGSDSPSGEGGSATLTGGYPAL